MLIKAERDRVFKRRHSKDQFVQNCGRDTLESEDCNECEANHCGHEVNKEIQLNHMKKVLWNLSRYHLEVNDWKRLARIWGFTEEQIKGMD